MYTLTIRFCEHAQERYENTISQKKYSSELCLLWVITLCKLSSCGHLSPSFQWLVIKIESARKCNSYFDPISISDLKKESIARSRLSVSGT